MTAAATAPPAAAPGAAEVFRCERQRATLTTAACARMWRAAQGRAPAPWESLAHCRACPVGATHAGRPDLARFAPAAALLRVCPRCTRAADRLIHGRLCVSCYNRDLEARKGRNAKGGVPRLAAVLGDAELVVIDGGGGTRRVRQARVASLAEALRLVARSARGPIAFGRPARDAAPD